MKAEPLWEKGSLFVFEPLTTVLIPSLHPREMRLQIREKLLYCNSQKKALEFLPSGAAEGLPFNLKMPGR